jgi:hypothetical protein
MCVRMRFFSRGSHGRRGNNRGRGLGPWKMGNKRLQFSIHFDADSEEFNQLLQTSFLNLAGQQAYRPPLMPENPRPSIDILVPNHVSSPLVRPNMMAGKMLYILLLDSHMVGQILITLNTLLFMPGILLLPCINNLYPKPHMPIMPRPRSLSLRIVQRRRK